MIQYYGDPLVQPELCRLLYLTVPEKFHVPVTFHNRRNTEGRRYLLGDYALADGAPRINVYLNPIYAAARGYGSRAAVLWKTLLDVCYHEFGHAATAKEREHVSVEAYHHDDRASRYVEGLADAWRDRRLAILLDHDPRLSQPHLLSGYLGARVARQMKWWAEHQDDDQQIKARLVKETRMLKAGGQLSAGDALLSLDISPRDHTNAYDVLRRASAGIGIDYLDGAGRHHKLYTWGDLPLLRRRLDPQRLRRVYFEAREFRIGVFSNLDGLKRELLICSICARRDLRQHTLFGDLRQRRHLSETEVERFSPLLQTHGREHADRGESES